MGKTITNISHHLFHAAFLALFFPQDADKRKFRRIGVIHPISLTVESGNNLMATELSINWSAGRVI